MTHDNNVQVGFLKKLKEEKTPATVFIKNGVQMHGTITSFDDRVIILSGRMVYPSAISTIEPHYPPRPHYVDATWGGDAL